MTRTTHAASSPRHRAGAACGPLAGASPDEACDAPEALGPGWYESSWDLLSGLDVCEAPPPDAWTLACQAA